MLGILRRQSFIVAVRRQIICSRNKCTIAPSFSSVVDTSRNVHPNAASSVTDTSSHESNSSAENKIRPHVPVMAREVVNALKPESGKTYIDMTFGAGGHSKKILETAPDVKIIAVDRDPDAMKYMHEIAEKYPNQVTPLCGRFSELPSLLESIHVREESIDGILFDFGCSSMQFDQPERGFSISSNGPLDMRMDKNRYPDEPTAADALATIDEADLAKMIKIYGGEKLAKKIARTIIDVRYALKPIRTTNDLANIVASCFDENYHLDPLNRPMHNATKTFQALRIFVNNELNEINYGIQCAEKYLKNGGRLVTLTFHSLEDTIVKRHLQGQVVQGIANALALKYVSQLQVCEQNTIESFMSSTWKPIYKHVIIPSPKEVDLNPRSRSAKLRAAIKTNVDI